MNLNFKCAWSGKRSPRTKSVTLKTLDRFSIPTEKTFYVLPEHEQELRDFNKKFVKNGQLFLGLIIGLTLLLPIVAFMAMIFSFSNSIILLAVGIITSLIGLVIILFPFATPETATWLGLKRTLILTRSVGFIVVILGILISVFPSF